MQVNEIPSIGTTLTYGEAILAYNRFERSMLEKGCGAGLLSAVGLYDLLWQLESLAQKWIGYTDVDSSGRGAGDGGPYMRDPRHPRHFTDDFKRQIVDLYNDGKPKREAMDEYDLGKSTVERRVKSINATGSPRSADNRTPERNRILEPQRESRRLRMEVDVLKRAASICARE